MPHTITGPDTAAQLRFDAECDRYTEAVALFMDCCPAAPGVTTTTAVLYVAFLRATGLAPSLRVFAKNVEVEHAMRGRWPGVIRVRAARGRPAGYCGVQLNPEHR